MRYKLYLLLFLVGISSVMGCRARRQFATTETVSSEDSSYWAGCQSCDSSPARLSGETPGGHVVESVTRRPWLERLRQKAISESASTLTCQGCDEKYGVLVDGLCLDCMKNQASSDFKQTIETLPQKLDGSQANHRVPPTNGPFERRESQFNRLPTPKQVDAIVNQKKTPAFVPSIQSDKLPAKSVGAKPGRSEGKNNFIPSKSPTSNDNFVSKTTPDATNSTSIPDPQEPRENESSLQEFLEKSNLDVLQSELRKTAESLEKQIPTKSDIPSVVDETAPADPESEEAIDTEIAGEIEPSASDSQSTKSVSNTGVSGGASLNPDPKFETFSLDDLFGVNEADSISNDSAESGDAEDASNVEDIDWGPPTKPSSKTKKKRPKTPRIRPNNKQSEPPRPRNWRSSRTEEEVYKSLANSTVKEKIVFDNSPVIAEELTVESSQEIVLRAKPSEFYHEIQRLAEEKKQRENDGILAINPVRHLQVPAMQAKASRLIQRKKSFDFSPLPAMDEVLEQVLDLDSTSEISNQVFDPIQFPRTDVPTHLQEQGASPTGDPLQPGKSNDSSYRSELMDAIYSTTDDLITQIPELSVPQRETQGVFKNASFKRLRTLESPNSEQSDSVKTTAGNKTQPPTAILLKAIPKRTDNDMEAIEIHRKSQAKFQFVQPNRSKNSNIQ